MNVGGLFLQKLHRELQECELQLLASKGALSRAQGQVGELQHEVGGLRRDVADERRQRVAAQALVKEYEGGVTARCAQESAPRP